MEATINELCLMSMASFDVLVPSLLHHEDTETRNLASPPIYCRNTLCGEPLIVIEFRDHYCYACDNIHCALFRQHQGDCAKNPEALPETTRYRSVYPSYEAYKKRKRKNYRALRNLGIEPKQANLMSSSNKQTQLALEMSTNE